MNRTGTPLTYAIVSHRKASKVRILTFVSSSTMPSRYRYTEYLLANRVCSVSKSESFAKEGLMYDMRHPFVSNCLLKNECNIAARERMARIVVMSVRGEQDHGLRNLERRTFCRDSGILSAAMASFEGTEMTEERPFSICPFRATASGSDGFQLVLLGRLLLAVEGLDSVLFRRSNSDVF